MKRSLSSNLFLVIAASVAMAGCGGGGEASLSKAEFIKRADAICEKADNVELGELGAYLRAHPGLSKQKPAEVRKKALLAIGFPSILKEALGAPNWDEKTIEEFLAGIRKAVKEAEKDPTKAEEDLPNGTGKNPEYSFRAVNKLANEFGFKQCNEVV
jgi:hypothetical protein